MIRIGTAAAGSGGGEDSDARNGHVRRRPGGAASSGVRLADGKQATLERKAEFFLSFLI